MMTNFGNFALTALSFFVVTESLLSFLQGHCIWSLISSFLQFFLELTLFSDFFLFKLRLFPLFFLFELPLFLFIFSLLFFVFLFLHPRCLYFAYKVLKLSNIINFISIRLVSVCVPHSSASILYAYNEDCTRHWFSKMHL